MSSQKDFLDTIGEDREARILGRGLNDADPLLIELLIELGGFSELLKEYGLEVAIDSVNSRAAWALLDEKKKQGILKIFSSFYRNCLELHSDGISLRDNRAFVFHSLKRASLFAKDDTNSLFNNDNLVEVYDLSDVQIFRSINFFDYCNYSLLDLLAREWMDLYERLPSVTKSLIDELRAAVEARELRPFSTPAHVMKERDANPRGIFQTDLLWCCPLFDAIGNLMGYLLVWDVAEIDLEVPAQQKLAFFRN